MISVYCGVSFHGYGHLTQTSLVFDQLARKIPELSLTVQCMADKPLLQHWIKVPFRHVQLETDQGLQMVHASRVDVDASFQAYWREYQSRSSIVSRLKTEIAKSDADVVITNNSYLLSRAAAELGIPSFHFCSLNWAAMFNHYCGHYPQASIVYDFLCESYNQAECFFAVTPGMPGIELAKVKPVGALIRQFPRIDLADGLGLPRETRFGLVSMGGHAYPMDYSRLPQRKNLVWLVPGNVAREDIVDFRLLPVPHGELLASTDLVVCKPGYGTFTECAISGIPVAYLQRDDWPETAYLVEWLERYVPTLQITADALLGGGLSGAIELVGQKLPCNPTTPAGAVEIVDEIFRLLIRPLELSQAIGK